MKIILQNIGKRFNKEWIFRNVSYEFSMGNNYSILGTNGSGKSTLLQIIAGSLSQTEGEIKFDKSEVRSKKSEANSQQQEFIFKNISYAAPYLELPEEMTWKEAITFHNKFKKFVSGFDLGQIINLSGLESSSEKQIRNFSSGMKQRLKYACALLHAPPVLMLDEPTANLDLVGRSLVESIVKEQQEGGIVIIATNEPQEIAWCEQTIDLDARRAS